MTIVIFIKGFIIIFYRDLMVLDFSFFCVIFNSLKVKWNILLDRNLNDYLPKKIDKL